MVLPKLVLQGSQHMRDVFATIFQNVAILATTSALVHMKQGAADYTATVEE